MPKVFRNIQNPLLRQRARELRGEQPWQCWQKQPAQAQPGQAAQKQPVQSMTQTHHRRSIRLPGYDYAAAGAYFITVCTHGRECLFGQIVDGEMRLNALGEIVRDEWEKSATIRAEIEIREYVIMPNHIHAIVIIHWVGRGDPLRGQAGRSPVRQISRTPLHPVHPPPAQNQNPSAQ